MPQRNGPRSSKGRSAVARKAIFSGTGKTNGSFPQGSVVTSTGEVIPRAGFFGGMKKGGLAPSATGFMTPSGKRATIHPGKAPPASTPNFLFKFKTNAGPSPFGYSPKL